VTVVQFDMFLENRNKCAWQYFYLCLEGKTVLLSFMTYATYYHEQNRLGTKLAQIHLGAVYNN
jgi:hypothetical protein